MSRRQLEVSHRGHILFSVTGDADLLRTIPVQNAFFDALWKAVGEGPGTTVYVYDGEQGQRLG